MLDRNFRKQSYVVKVDTYNSIKNQLENQNASLMQERYNLQQQTNPTQDYLPSIILPENQLRPQPNQISVSPVKKHFSPSTTPIENLREKISDIISICHNQTSENQFGQIAEAQKQILSYLDRLQDNKKSLLDNPQKKSKAKSRLNKTEISEKSSKPYLSGEALEMIEEIQRKALIQIQSLRMDKCHLLKRLNDQIRAHNQERRIRQMLEGRVRNEQTAVGGKVEKYMEVVDEENEDDHNDHDSALRSKGNRRPSHLDNQASSQRQLHHAQTAQFNSLNQIPNRSSLKKFAPSPSPSPSPTPSPTYLIPSHPPSHPPLRPSPPTTTHNINIQLLKYIQQLNKQNKKIKQALANTQHPSLKLQLRSQLGQLEGKIRFYEQELSHRQRSTNNVGVNQLESLILQANTITEGGNNLLKNNGRLGTGIFISENRISSNTYNQDEQYNQTSLNTAHNHKPIQNRSTFQYTRPPLQTFSPMDKSYHNHYKSRFSPTKYENIIQEMNQAIKI